MKKRRKESPSGANAVELEEGDAPAADGKSSKESINADAPDSEEAAVNDKREKNRRKKEGKHAEGRDEGLEVDVKEPKPDNSQPDDVLNKREKKKRRSTDASLTEVDIKEIEASQAAESRREKKKQKNQAADDVPIKREKKRKHSSIEDQTDVEVGDKELDSKVLAASTAANEDSVPIKREKKRKKDSLLEGRGTDSNNGSGEETEGEKQAHSQPVDGVQSKREKKKRKSKNVNFSDVAVSTADHSEAADKAQRKKKHTSTADSGIENVEVEASQAAESKPERKNQAAYDVPVKREKRRKHSSSDEQKYVNVGDVELNSEVLAASAAADDDSVPIKREKKKRKNDSSSEGRSTDSNNGAGEGEKLADLQCVDGVRSNRKKKKTKSKYVNSGIENVELDAKELAASVDDHSQVADGAKREQKKKKKVRFGPDVILNEIPPNKPEDVIGKENKTEQETFGDAKILNQDSVSDRPIAEQYSKQAKFLQPFTPEEDEIIRQTVNRFCEARGLEREEVYRYWTFGGGNRKDKREILDDLAKNLPDRERSSVRRRARFALDTFNKKGKWTEEEVDELMRLVEEHGRKWAKLESLMNRSRYALARVWAYRRGQAKKGHYTHEEIEKVTAEVHKALANNIKLGVPKTRRDDIPWQAIAAKVPGRPHSHLRVLWYRDLCSPMTKNGEWGSSDDHLLLVSILESGAVEEESIEWDKLLSHRSGVVCKKRWNEMRAHLGHMWQWPLEKKLEVLLKRYAPCFLEPGEQPCAIEAPPATDTTFYGGQQHEEEEKEVEEEMNSKDYRI